MHTFFGFNIPILIDKIQFSVVWRPSLDGLNHNFARLNSAILLGGEISILLG